MLSSRVIFKSIIVADDTCLEDLKSMDIGQGWQIVWQIVQVSAPAIDYILNPSNAEATFTFIQSTRTISLSKTI